MWLSSVSVLEWTTTKLITGQSALSWFSGYHSRLWFTSILYWNENWDLELWFILGLKTGVSMSLVMNSEEFCNNRWHRRSGFFNLVSNFLLLVLNKSCQYIYQKKFSRESWSHKRKWRSHKLKLTSLFLLRYFSLSKMFDVWLICTSWASSPSRRSWNITNFLFRFFHP